MLAGNSKLLKRLYRRLRLIGYLAYLERSAVTAVLWNGMMFHSSSENTFVNPTNRFIGQFPDGV